VRFALRLAVGERVIGFGERFDRLDQRGRRLDAPSQEAIEEYLRASGKTDGDGARRAGKWYEEILEGKRHRDYTGRTIR
jgi:hypothetical protein